MPSKHTDTTRRRLLKSIGATGLAFGVAGTASARDVPVDELERVEAAHRDPTRAQWAAAQHADPVLAELADKGVLERGDVAELDFENPDVKAFHRDGTTVAQIATTTQADDATVEFVARPQTGRVYATVRPADGAIYTVERAAGDDDVSTEACWYEHDCASVACSGGGGCAYLERRCCNPCIQEASTQEASTDAGTESCETSCYNWEEVGCCTC